MKFFNKYYFFGVGSGIVLTIIIIIVFMAIMIRAFDGPGTKQGAGNKTPGLQPPRALTDQRSSVYKDADNATLQRFNGDYVKLTQFKGKVVFINFWATWCGPCVAEMPDLQEFYNELKDEDVVFLFITNEKKEAVQEFIVEKQYTLPVFFQNSGPLPIIFDHRSIPTTFILDKEGRIVVKYSGSANWNCDPCKELIRGLSDTP